jgi:hypothetical protein
VAGLLEIPSVFNKTTAAVFEEDVPTVPTTYVVLVDETGVGAVYVTVQ